jgi:hypothetical protein
MVGARVFPFVGKLLEPKDFEHNDYMFYSWRNVQEDVENMVESILKATREPADDDVWDPRAGRGWSYFDLRTLLVSGFPEALEYWAVFLMYI